MFGALRQALHKWLRISQWVEKNVKCEAEDDKNIWLKV